MRALKTCTLKIVLTILILFVPGILIFSGSAKVREYIKTEPDTLNVPYTYWQPSGGPFTGLCGNPYSLVFSGKVTKLYDKIEHHPTGVYEDAVLYTGQKGIIEIAEMKFKHAPEEGYKKTPGYNYNGEHYFVSDCFYGSGLKEGDKVIVFIYSYEGEYCIPGKSILKIGDYKDPAVRSVEKYIKNDQNPLSIRADTSLWAGYGLDDDLKQIIDCRLSSMNDTLQVRIKIKNMIEIGWGTKYNCEILEIKNGELSGIGSTFIMSFAIGAERRFAATDRLTENDTYLVAFTRSSERTDKPYIPAGTTGFLDKNGIIWYITKIRRVD
jgi:hypothetical protein